MFYVKYTSKKISLIDMDEWNLNITIDSQFKSHITKSFIVYTNDDETHYIMINFNKAMNL